MLRNNRSYILLTWLPLFLVFALLILMRLRTQHQDQAAKSKPYGRYTAEQIVNLTEAMCGDLVPTTSRLYFSPVPVTTHERSGMELRIWQVEYRDMEGHFNGVFQWNAETGLVQQVSQQLPEDLLSSGRLTAERAADVSLYWMERLQVMQGQTWRLETAPQYSQGEWKCQFLSANARIVVIIRASDGLLIFAHLTGVALRL